MSVTLTQLLGDFRFLSSGSTNSLPTSPPQDLLFYPAIPDSVVNMEHPSPLVKDTPHPPARGRGVEEGSSAFFTVWAVVAVLMTLAVVTLVANGTILTMFVLRKSLRKCKNVYIASLAAADLAIGFTIPVAILEQVEKRWTLDGLGCRLYLTLRSSLLYVSLLSILLISIDRWWSIHYPFSYRVRQSKRLAACAVGLVWVTSFAVHMPPIMFWGDVFGPAALHTNASDDNGVVAMLSPVKSSSPFSPSSSASRQNPSPLLSALTASASAVASTTTSGFLAGVPLVPQEAPALADASYHLRSAVRSYTEFFNAGRRCELPYASQFSFVLTLSVLQYFFPLLALWLLNSSLYFKITRRKSIKIRRSLSVLDNHHLLTLRKSSSESESSPNGLDSESLEISRAENRQRLLAAARAGRRHTYQFSSNTVRGGAAASHNSQNCHTRMLSRRTSLQDALPGVGTMAALAGAVPYLPRVTSCQRFANGSTCFLAGSSIAGSRGSACSVRKQSDDLVKELLVRQDKKAARCLGLLVTVLTICWLPYTVIAVLRAASPLLVSPWIRDVVFWVLLTNSAVNPFLYGLLNAEFRKILYGWFYFRRRRRYRLKQALLYWSLSPRLDTDSVKEKPHWHFRTIRE